MAAEDNLLPLTTLSGENLELTMQISSKAPPQLPRILSHINHFLSFSKANV